MATVTSCGGSTFNLLQAVKKERKFESAARHLFMKIFALWGDNPKLFKSVSKISTHIHSCGTIKIRKYGQFKPSGKCISLFFRDPPTGSYE